ncbi:hypothetical protein GLX30_30350 [Streptomyces sp. Tu 2975]|uniref:hypothetical protein n=1 Tax=Streptomyces sp. Tu 2975 TaxID=2676871 RepID=UPI0013577251|nr:hypothetical protein [Streptomyces sp. Tu 2975]QIP87616.1 hypothetical protein GLX30_30350 [Streptomyces sp. Tu 2975]
MSSWFEERRADKVADAEEQRRTRAFEAELRREERRKDRDEERADKAQARRDKALRKQARAARREKTLTPGNVYRKGTLLLVAMSALAAIPAQVAYFVKKSLMLLPVPFALEGAAWVMAAGVAYADERKLPAWVRWLLRAFCLSAAGFAARINYIHGSEQGALVGWGLAAVTMLGPLYFEVRQWVITLSAAISNPRQQAEERARRKHDRRRRRHHRDVAKVADRLVSAAPYGTLKPEEAWARAWAIVHGTTEPGMTPRMHAWAVKSAAALATAQQPLPLDSKTIRTRIEGRLHASAFVLPTASGTPLGMTKSAQVVTDLPPASKTREKTPVKPARRQPPAHRRSKGDALPFHPIAKTVAADTARKVTAVNGHH